MGLKIWCYRIAFVTNQELLLSERKILHEIDCEIDVEIYHLERIASLLNIPKNYGIRMEFLDIEMTKEEQLAFFASQTQVMSEIRTSIKQLTIGLEEFKQSQNLPAKKESTVNNDNFADEPRSIEEISNTCEELLDKIWFDRHLTLKYKLETGQDTVDPAIWKGALDSAQRVIEKYGEENLGPYSNFDWGMLNGKLSALRWVLGYEWDMLDT